ncbi:hypothetical protein WKI71_39935 [Streptomyces sp. MS1.AVA.1]|uniref:Uncharacterized protein n=1 Tax=Streptomyces machairae TaxID=3134109 RepID=A0ABU8UTQ8_9ACTN
MHAVADADLRAAGRFGAAQGCDVAQCLLADLGGPVVDLLPQRVLGGGHGQRAREYGGGSRVVYGGRSSAV